MARIDTTPAWRRLAGVAWELKADTLAAIACTIGVLVVEVSLPLFTGNAVDLAAGSRSSTRWTEVFGQYDPLRVIVVTLVTAALVRFVFQFGRRYSAGRLSITVQHLLRVRILRSILRLDGSEQDRLRTGEVVSRSISDLNQIQGILAMTPLAFGSMLKILVSMGIMLALSPPLALVAAVSLPLITLSAALTRRPLYAATWTAQQQAAEIATQVEEAVTGIRVVKAFGQENRETERMKHASADLFGLRMRVARLSARFIPVIERLPQLALLVNVVLGGVLAIRGTITVGVFVTFAAYLASLTGVARMAAGMLMRIYMGFSSVQRVFDLLDLRPSLSQPQHPRSLPDSALGLQFASIRFAPPGAAEPVLTDFSLTVPPGARVALVGPGGAGKTLLTQLVGRFYDPDAGTVSLIDTDHNAYPLPQCDIDAVRSRVAIVFDDPFLYSASIRENITVGADIPDHEVRRAMRVAHVQEFVDSLDAGMETVLGERGLDLSGGQRQRIALARALARGADILVLDDATSAIDAITEAEIYAGIKAEYPEVTILAVAHRLSTLELADTVALLDGGRCLAHDSLAQMQATPEFASLMDTEKGCAPGWRRDASVPFDSDECPDATQLWPPEHAHTAEKMPRIATAQRSAISGRGALMNQPLNEQLRTDIDALPPANEEPHIDVDWDSRGLSLRNLFTPVRGLIVAAILLLVVGVVADITVPTLVRYAIDYGVREAHTGVLMAIAGLGVGVVLISWASAVVQTIITARTGERLLYRLRLRSFKHIVNLSMDFFEKNLSGAIMTRMTTDIDALSSFLQTGLAQTIVSLATLLGISVMLLATDASLSLIAFAALPLVVAATVAFKRISTRLYRSSREQISRVNARFQESVGAVRTTHMHGASSTVLREFDTEATRYRRLRIRSHTAVSIYFPGINALSELAQAAVIGWGAVAVQRGEITPGVLVAFVMYLGSLFGPIQQLSQVFDSYQQANVGFTRIRALLATDSAVPDRGTRLGAHDAIASEIDFDAITFRYSPDSPAVTSDFSLTLEPGHTVAVVGHTGAGKSTVIKLLARFYDPSSGAVRANGIDIREFPLRDWRAPIGLVPQEAHLFSGTIASNIAYGNPHATQEQITAAAARVGALNAIASIPGGFYARVGERGRGLSSGQRQLVALARAELTRPALLLLDEATATVDPATENTILQASSRLTETRTAVVVAHRLNTAARADRILVLDHGCIIEDGTHDELLALKGTYWRMWNSHIDGARQAR